MRLLAFIVLVFTTPVAASDLPVPSVWENQSGSVLYLDSIDSDGRFTGRYVNGAAGYRCQGIEYAVSGRAFDPLISFTVVWAAEAETCHSITSWTGSFDGQAIDSEWSLVRWSDTGAETDSGGFARYAGESRFERRD
ncbi:avidin/streptavidin family protein [Hyphobacterium sp.]|jgi:hypothetical protein|uniref:avidin/streptavidin family protein n=1 Tax=Hyphobacterium sp. TaxID=2004662 RepID=UPI003BAAFFFE